jgi:polyhydroxyalkanoate synthase subunit PhaC
MSGEASSASGAGLDVIRRSSFILGDLLRGVQGDALQALGWGPEECTYREVRAEGHWRLRDYAEDDGSPGLLVVAAPIKRPYIWDLCPSASVIRCLRQRLHVYLLEWLPASQRQASLGIAAYVEAVAECVATIAGSRGAKPAVLGHSLGGTLAVIFACSAPESIASLVLLGVPLCFATGTSRFRDALVALTPPGWFDEGPCPGSLLSCMSALASPGTFVWSRLLDAAFSSGDRQAREVEARVQRWALDEVPLPGRLVYQIIDWLYRDDRLCQGTLEVGGTLIGPSRLSVPTLAVVNTSDEIAPAASLRPFTDAMPGDVRVIEYPGEVGVGLQHLAVLLGRQAHARLWPQIVSWLEARGSPSCS